MPTPKRLPSGNYQIRYTEPSGRRASRTFPTAGAANSWYRRTVADIVRGDYISAKSGRMRLRDWADEWLAGARNLSAGTVEMYGQALAHILPRLGAVPLAQLSASDIDHYLAGKLTELSPSTVHRHYRVLHRMLAIAQRRGMIARNPCEHVEPPRVPQVERAVLDVAQVDALATAITPRYRAWVYVMAYGGLRWSESIGLRRRNVDVTQRATLAGGSRNLAPEEARRDVIPPAINPGVGARPPPVTRGSDHTARHAQHPSNRIAVVEQLVHRRDGSWERAEPKARSRRTITLPSFAADELYRHIESYVAPGPESLIFTTRNGTSPQAGSFTTNVFRRALTRADLPRMRIHDLRHTAVSLAIAAGADAKASQARAGHASIRTHLDLYGHLLSGADEAVAQALEELHAQGRRRRLRAV